MHILVEKSVMFLDRSLGSRAKLEVDTCIYWWKRV
jgi:hypothetical protein